MLTSARLCMRLPVSVASCPKQALSAQPFSSGTQTGSSHSSWMGSGNTLWEYCKAAHVDKTGSGMTSMSSCAPSCCLWVGSLPKTLTSSLAT